MVGEIREAEGIKKFLTFLGRIGIKADRVYVFADRPAVAVPEDSELSLKGCSVEKGTFEDETGERLSLLIVSPSTPGFKDEWKHYWKGYKEGVKQLKEGKR